MPTPLINSTKPKETKVNLSQMVGGTFEAVVGSFLGTPPSYETREAITTPVPEYIQKAFSSGEIKDFQKPRDPEIQIRRLQSQLSQARQEILTKEPLTAKRIDVNTKIGGIGNVLYEDTVSDDGTLRRDVKTYLTRKNSELEAGQLEAKRKSFLVQAIKKTAPKGAIGPKINLNTRFEDRNTDSPG